MIGEILKNLRHENDITQSSMAEFLCVKRQTYGAYERNVSIPDANTLKKLSDFFNVSTDYLLGLTDTKKETTQNEQSPVPTLQEFLEVTKNFSKSDIDKIVEYADMLKLKEQLKSSELMKEE